MLLNHRIAGSVPILNRTITEINELFRGGQLSPVELFERCRKRLELTKVLNAYINDDPSVGREHSKLSEERFQHKKSLGSLDGIPVSFKDNFSTKNFPTTCASKMLANYHPPFDATVVERLLGSGVIPIGKTNMDEFAMGSACSESFFGPTFHPWQSSIPGLCYIDTVTGETIATAKTSQDSQEWFITGGSSGGAAVSVATGTSFAALSSDTGGSTRNPASRLGIVGFKPSYGVISRYGLIPLTHSLDVPGIMARTVADVISVFRQLHGWDHRDSTSVRNSLEDFSENFELNNVIIGIPDEYHCPDLDPTIEKIWKDSANTLRDAGAEIRTVSMPHTRLSLPCYTILNTCEVASNFACYDGIEYGHRTNIPDLTFEDHYSATREEGLNDIVKARIIAGNYFLLAQNYRQHYEKALKVRRLITEDFDRVFTEVDFLLTPVCITRTMSYRKWMEMDKTEEAIREDYCTQPANMAGVPALSLPITLDKENHHLPVGLQIIAPKFQDFRLLNFGSLLQERLFRFPKLIFES